MTEEQFNLLANLVLAIEGNQRAMEIEYGWRQRFDTWILAQELADTMRPTPRPDTEDRS